MSEIQSDAEPSETQCDHQMIERVARAIYEAMDVADSLALPEATRYARAAIVAMREPTDDMATHPMATCYNYGPYGDKEVRRIYSTMIEVALGWHR